MQREIVYHTQSETNSIAQSKDSYYSMQSDFPLKYKYNAFQPEYNGKDDDLKSNFARISEQDEFDFDELSSGNQSRERAITYKEVRFYF